MPRLLSSYAANKRVEDGLKKKQEQIRKDYMRAIHRHLDETDKLVDELIQIHVRTPSAFQPTPTGSANSQNRRTPNLPTPHHHNHHGQHQQQNNGVPQQSLLGAPAYHHGSQSSHLDSVSTQQYMMRGGRPRGHYPNEGTITTDDGTLLALRRDIPPPVIQVRGEEVFYQYDCRPNQWKKLEPTYKTKVLLHRNRAVVNALKDYDEQRRIVGNANTDANNPPAEANLQPTDQTLDPDQMSHRRSSTMSRRSSLYQRRGSEFHRRSSRRGSRFYCDDEDADRIPPIVELKPQLSPGHTPRMLDGWTLMNWFLWKKPQQKPVWASKRYMDRKSREFKRYQASKSATANGKEQQQIPAKPSSAHAATREARRKESMALTAETDAARFVRAKSVPIQRSSSAIDEVDEFETEDESQTVDVEKGILRPTTSILRKNSGKKGEDLSNRPKTTYHQSQPAVQIPALRRIGLTWTLRVVKGD